MRQISLAVDAVGVSGGGAVVMNAVLPHLLAHPAIHVVHLFVDDSGRALPECAADPKLKVHDCASRIQGPVRRLIWPFVGLPSLVDRCKADALFALCNMGLARRPKRLVVLIQQSLTFSSEALSRCDLKLRLRMTLVGGYMRMSAKRADRIIVQTSWMQGRLQARWGIHEDRVAVVTPYSARFSCGLGDRIIRETAHGSDRAGSDVLYVGTGYGYKNLSVAFDAITILRRNCSNSRLLVTLPPSQCPPRDGVVCLGTRTSDQLCRDYQTAGLLVMPSLVETVGIPMLEAMENGLPIVAADRPYAHEVCGNAAVYFDPNSAADCALKIQDVLASGALRARLVAEGAAIHLRRRNADPYRQMADIIVDAATTTSLPASDTAIKNLP